MENVWPELLLHKLILNYNPLQCPCCKQNTMHRLISFERGPPASSMALAADLLYAIIKKKQKKEDGSAMHIHQQN